MSTASQQKPEPHPGIAGLAIAVMGLVLALVLERMGVLVSIDGRLGVWVDSFGLDGANRVLDAWVPWCWATIMTVGLCQAVVHVQENWRRMVLIVGAVGLTLCWIPVLALAAFHPPLSVALVALIWGGAGSFVYAARHREVE